MTGGPEGSFAVGDGGVNSIMDRHRNRISQTDVVPED